MSLKRIVSICVAAIIFISLVVITSFAVMSGKLEALEEREKDLIKEFYLDRSSPASDSTKPLISGPSSTFQEKLEDVSDERHVLLKILGVLIIA